MMSANVHVCRRHQSSLLQNTMEFCAREAMIGYWRCGRCFCAALRDEVSTHVLLLNYVKLRGRPWVEITGYGDMVVGEK